MKISKDAHTTSGRKKNSLKAIGTVPTFEEISDLAYQQWLKRGCSHGFDIEDWLNAEYELLHQEDLVVDDIDDR